MPLTASRLGYDGVEVMVYTDPVSQDVDVFSQARRLPPAPGAGRARPEPAADPAGVGSRAVGEAPAGPGPRPARRRQGRRVAPAVPLAARVRPRDSRAPGRDGRGNRHRLRGGEHVPVRAGASEDRPYAPTWDPTAIDVAHVTLDFSHAAASGSDALVMAEALGTRLTHVHLTDGTGDPIRPVPNQHLVPGRGSQPLRRGARAAGLDQVPRHGRGRGQHPPGAATGAPRRPGRVAGLRPRAPGPGGG